MATWEKKVDPDDVGRRLRRLVSRLAPLVEKRMFGGLCFMWRGHMLCGVGKPGFLFRVDPGLDPAAEHLVGGEPMTMAGRTSRGFYWVDPGACDDAMLRAWLDRSKAHVRGLPPKT